MKIVIAGGTGFLGRPLADAFAEERHYVTILTRGTAGVSPTPRVRLVQWAPNGQSAAWTSEIDGADAVVNLAGASIAKRWSETQKQQILNSRVRATRRLVEAIAAAASPPSVFLSGSAVGYYGPLAH